MDPKVDDPRPEEDEVEELDEFVLSRAESRLQWSVWNGIRTLDQLLLGQTIVT